MKLKLKLMAAAVALVAASGANAAITQSGTGNGELFFTIYDLGADGAGNTADDRAYVRDLGSLANGGALNNWAAATGQVPALAADKQAFGTILSISADANLASFLTASTDISRLRWNIAAADSSGADRILTTAATTPAAPNYAQFRNWGTQGVDIYLAAMNPALTGESALYDGAAVNFSKWGDNMGGKTAFSTTAGLGSSIGFFLLSEKVATGATTTNVQQYMADANTAMQWTLAANGELTYGALSVPAIPEPSEYALMLAGLGMLGFMARRRLSNRV